MALLQCRVSPKPERFERIRVIEAKAILAHLERAGEDLEIQPSNIGE
jgi:hypothetical protein